MQSIKTSALKRHIFLRRRKGSTARQISKLLDMIDHKRSEILLLRLLVKVYTVHFNIDANIYTFMQRLRTAVTLSSPLLTRLSLK
jgi:hypothetical protein